MATTQEQTSVPVFKPHLDEETYDAAVAALRMGWLGMGSYVRDFEAALDNYLELDGRHAVTVNTGTSAIHLALLLAGVGPGDEVITPSFNNIADFQAIRMTGAEPVFCDICDDTLGIDVESASRLIGPKTKVIIGMDYAGVPCDLGSLHELAASRGLRVLHDAAHSIGSRHDGKMLGSQSDLAVFSFDPVKTITSIDGGALVVRSRKEVESLHRWRLLGMDQRADRMYTNNRAWTYDVATDGYRYHLANLHASIGLTQLARIEEFIQTRRASCRLYDRLLADVPGLVTPKTTWADVAPFIYYVRIEGGRRQQVIDGLKERGVDTGIHWIPGHRFSHFQDCRAGDLPVTDRVGDEILTLPLHSYMPTATVERVASTLISVLA